MIAQAHRGRTVLGQAENTPLTNQKNPMNGIPMKTYLNRRLNTSSSATHRYCLINATAGFEEAVRILCLAYSHADDDIQLAIVRMCESLGVPPLETLNPECLPAAVALAVATLANEGADLGC